MNQKEYDFNAEKERLSRALGELQDRLESGVDELPDDAEAKKLRDHVYDYLKTLTEDTYLDDGGYDPNECTLNNDGDYVSILDMRDRIAACFDSLGDRLKNLRDIVNQTCDMIDEIADPDFDTYEDEEEPRMYKEFVVGYDGDILMVIKNNCVVNVLRGDVAGRVCGLLEAELHFEDEKDGFGIDQ